MNDTRAIRSFTDLVYAAAGEVSLLLDLHMPEGVALPQLVVWLHGGGWHAGDKSDCRVKYLVEQGYAVASVNYRLTDVACFPAQIHDCKAAIRWLRAMAGTFGYTVGKLVVAGGSAGGHLASLLGTTNGHAELEGTLGEHTDQSSHVDGVVNFYGPQDFILRAQTQPDQVLPVGSIVWKLLGCRADENEALAKLASPAWQVSSATVPFLIFQGDGDLQVLPDQQESLMDALQAHHIAHRYFIGPGFVHGDMRFYQAPYREPVVAFLREIVG